MKETKGKSFIEIMDLFTGQSTITFTENDAIDIMETVNVNVDDPKAELLAQEENS